MNAHPVTIQSLQRGLRQLFAYRTGKGQSGQGLWDFNNTLYSQLEEYRCLGLNKAFWEFLVDELWRWRAIRPLSKQQVHDEGLPRIPELQRCLNRLVRDADRELPAIEAVEWDDISSLFEVAQRIKPVKGPSKPMFASKLCHFLIPTVYFVTDGTLVKRGWNDYRQYWEECRDAWISQPDKQALMAELQEKMPARCLPSRTFPWATKIVELCQFDVE